MQTFGSEFKLQALLLQQLIDMYNLQALACMFACAGDQSLSIRSCEEQ